MLSEELLMCGSRVWVTGVSRTYHIAKACPGELYIMVIKIDIKPVSAKINVMPEHLRVQSGEYAA